MLKRKTSLYRVIAILLLAVIAFTFIFPFYWILTGSLKKQNVAI